MSITLLKRFGIDPAGVAAGGGGLPDALTPNANNPLVSNDSYGFGSVALDGGTYYAFMSMSDDTIDLYTASNPDGPWASQGQVLAASDAWEDGRVSVPYVWAEGGTWYMLYRGHFGEDDAVGLATASAAAGPWSKDENNPVIAASVAAGWEGASYTGAEATGPIKVDGTYYVLVEARDEVSAAERATGVFTSTDLVNWSPQDGNPILENGRFCGFIFAFSGLYWLVTPHYTAGGGGGTSGDEAEFELYRSPRPSFRQFERKLADVIYSAANVSSPTWDHKDIDTPVVLTPDVTREVGDTLRIYYAGSATGDFTDGGLGLLESGDPAGVLGVLAGLAFMHVSAADWNAGTLTDAQVSDEQPDYHAVVLPHVDGTTAISQTSNATTAAGIGADDDDEIGNTFTPASDINGFAVEAYLEVLSAPTHELRCNLYDQDMSGGSTQGSPAPIASVEITHTSTGWARFEFPTTVLSGSQTYTYTIETTGSEGTDRYNVKSDGSDPYAGGRYTYWSVTNLEYRHNGSFDCAFKIIELDASSPGTLESAELDISSVGTASGTTKISWDATEPSGATVTMETRVSTDGGSSWTSWSSVTNGGGIPGITSSLDVSNGRVQYRATLTTTGASPALEQVFIEVEAQ